MLSETELADSTCALKTTLHQPTCFIYVMLRDGVMRGNLT